MDALLNALAILLVLFFVLNVADFILTDKVIENGGHESNFVLAAIMGLAGPTWRVIKMAVVAFCIVVLWRIGPQLWTYLAAVALNAAWVYVVYHNYMTWQRQLARRRK